MNYGPPRLCLQLGFQTNVFQILILLSPTLANLSSNLVRLQSLALIHPVEPEFLVHAAKIKQMWHCVTYGLPFEEQWPQTFLFVGILGKAHSIIHVSLTEEMRLLPTTLHLWKEFHPLKVNVLSAHNPVATNTLAQFKLIFTLILDLVWDKRSRLLVISTSRNSRSCPVLCVSFPIPTRISE